MANTTNNLTFGILHQLCLLLAITAVKNRLIMRNRIQLLRKHVVRARKLDTSKKKMLLKKSFKSSGIAANNGPSTSKATTVPVSFDEYRKRKEADRSSRFKTSKKKNVGVSKKAKVQVQEAKVQVGLVCEGDLDGKLKRMKGRTIPVLLNEDDDADALLRKAIEKHARHFKQFNKDDEYLILYQDMTIIKHLPGCDAPFTVGNYKRDILKPYSKIYFWLCSKEDFGNSTFCDDNESDVDHVLLNTSSLSENKNSNPCAPSDDIILVPHDDKPPSSQSLLPSGSNTIEKYFVNTHQCPTCYKFYPRNEIEAHADVCAESWIDTVGCSTSSEANLHENLDDESEDSYAVDQMEDISQRFESIKRIVGTLKSNVKNTVINRIAIRRRFVFADYMGARLKKYYKPQGLLKVSFTGEPAVDGGGPRREFFTEALNHIKLRLFDEQGFPVVNVQALANEEFKVAGEIMASSIVLEGPAPCLFSSIVYDYIVRGIGSVQAFNWTEQLRDEKMKMAMQKIKACESDHQLTCLLNEESMMDILDEIGYRGVISKETLHTRNQIIRSLVITGVSKTLAMIDQLISGLETYGVLTSIRKHRELMQPLLALEGADYFKITPDIMLDHLVGDYSPDGSNKKPLEIDVHKYYCDYVQEIGAREESGNNLSKLYQFITGAKSVTPLGLEKSVTIKFKHGCAPGCKCRPTSSSCDSSITFPIHFKDSEDFESVMDGALMESSEFGLV